jgi:GcrA cell cycle regulator
MPAQQTNYLPTWTTERVEILKRGVEAGLSCREIAAQIGVSRNAVIGKISRLKLAREKTGLVRAATTEPAGARRPRATMKLRQIILRSAPAEQSTALEEPIHNGHTCSLFELTKETCRWPISTPGAEDFCFCGNPPIAGLPYCAGHSRLAYRIGSQR